MRDQVDIAPRPLGKDYVPESHTEVCTIYAEIQPLPAAKEALTTTHTHSHVSEYPSRGTSVTAPQKVTVNINVA